MSNTVQSVEAEALRLSPEERVQLIEQLAATIAPAHTLHPAWDAEITRRVADLDAGHVRLLDGDEVLADSRKRISPAGPQSGLPPDA